MAEVKLENSVPNEVALNFEVKGITSTLEEKGTLCKTLTLKGGKAGEMKTSKPFLLEGLQLA